MGRGKKPLLDAQGRKQCANCTQHKDLSEFSPTIRRVGRNKRSEIVPALHIDHSHTTGRIRGLLCSPCNQALGLLEEDPQRIKALLRYVEERVLQSSFDDVKIEGEG